MYPSYCTLTAFRSSSLNKKLRMIPSFFQDRNHPFINYYLNHTFDLLGSGWTKIRYGIVCRGLEGHRYDYKEEITIDSDGNWLQDRINSANLPEAQRIWRLIDPKYIPIDWQIDFKSGYRWKESTWYKDIKFGHLLGVDVKVPWELARMQHLPQLALAFTSQETEYSCNPALSREFRNQVIDFIATNPPRFGVNWSCPMDVAIRAANWLLAYDIFRSAGAQFDEEFEHLFHRSIYEHGLHIVGNLESFYGIRANHYLANIAGLAFIAVHLESTTQTDAWLAFAVQELIFEVEHQFHSDGGNFEGSTAYHRLSTEMVYFTTALILGLPEERMSTLKSYSHKELRTGIGKPSLKPSPLPFYALPEGTKCQLNESPFPAWYFERLERMAEFIVDITKPSGHIPQIGDNDSGRFFKLNPLFESLSVQEVKATYANLKDYQEMPNDADYLLEDQLNCMHIVEAACALFDRTDFGKWLEEHGRTASKSPDYGIIKALSAGLTIGSLRRSEWRREKEKLLMNTQQNDFEQLLADIPTCGEERVRRYEFYTTETDLLEGLSLAQYPDFGLYVYRSPQLYLAIRCWSGAEPFHGGHMHKDQLTIELTMNDKDIIRDPGSYVYTPLPEKRWLYRGAESHFPKWEDNRSTKDWDPLFGSLDIPKACLKLFTKDGFFAYFDCGTAFVFFSNTYLKFCFFNSKDSMISHQKIPLSTAYGWLSCC